MKAKQDRILGWIVTEGAERYEEKTSAEATSRVLDGSSDAGYASEYVGYGQIDGIPVKAIYLFDDDQNDVEDEGDLDWDTALSQGRIVVDVDRLTDKQWADLQKSGSAAALGSIKSDKKSVSSRENGKLGGRPLKPTLKCEICGKQKPRETITYCKNSVTKRGQTCEDCLTELSAAHRDHAGENGNYDD